jgi:ribosome-associated protein
VDIPEEIKLVCQAIVDKKGANVVTLDVRGISSITDYFIIAEGSVARHVVALAQYVDEVLRKRNITPVHSEGMREGEWIVLDYMGFMIHLFIPELRQHYALEEVWKEGCVVNVPVEYGRSTPLIVDENKDEISRFRNSLKNRTVLES